MGVESGEVLSNKAVKRRNGRPQEVKVQTEDVESNAAACSLPQLPQGSAKFLFGAVVETTYLRVRMATGRAKRIGVAAGLPLCENPLPVPAKLEPSKVPSVSRNQLSLTEGQTFTILTPNI